MIELKNKYNNKNAIIILGGPSILENNYDLSLLSNKDDIIFLESNEVMSMCSTGDLRKSFLLLCPKLFLSDI